MKKIKSLEEAKEKFDTRKDLHQWLLSYTPACVFKFLNFLVYHIFRYFILSITFIAEIRKIYDLSNRKFNGGLSYDQLQLDLGNLSKLPRHMTFVINEDVPTDFCDIGNLVVWTIAMGIPYITLYHQSAFGSSEEKTILKVVQLKLAKFFSVKGPSDINVVMRSGKSTFKNGMVFPREVSVHLLSEDDGKADIVNTAINLASDYKQKKVKMKDVDIQYIDKSLSASQNTPDPDLIIQFGKIYSLKGFLPWQTRLSEILHHPTLQKISYPVFRNWLMRYSKCDQRFGK